MNILITGASKGIGFATVNELLKRENTKVFALSRSRDGLSKLEEENKKLRTGSGLKTFTGDIRDENFISSTAEEICREEGSLQAIINNAGMLISKSFSEITKAEWEDVYSVNVFGALNVMRNFLPLLKASPVMNDSVFRSHVVNISSMGGVQGSTKFRGLSAYTSSKGALNTLTECLAEELKEEGIAVNALALGSVNTKMFADAFPGYAAGMNVEKIALYVAEFALSGHRYYNGKILPVTFSTP